MKLALILTLIRKNQLGNSRILFEREPLVSRVRHVLTLRLLISRGELLNLWHLHQSFCVHDDFEHLVERRLLRHQLTVELVNVRCEEPR